MLSSLFLAAATVTVTIAIGVVLIIGILLGGLNIFGVFD